MPFFPSRLCSALVLGAAVTAFAVQIPQASAKDLKIVTTIPPLHSLVSLVTGDLQKPEALLTGGESPHHTALKPSQAQALQDADVVFWIGPRLESFLTKTLSAAAYEDKSVIFLKEKDLHRLEKRESALFQRHKHGDHDHHHGHDHDKHDHDDHDDHEGHDNDAAMDAHLWLDPHNAGIMIRVIAETLAVKDPDNAKTYKDNAKAAQAALKAQTEKLKKQLAGLEDKGFVVFHDAYQYFEKRFGLNAVASLTLNPEVKPGAQHIRTLQKMVKETNATCAFREPQFSDRLLNPLTTAANLKVGVLDPLGAGLDAGPDLYSQLLDNLANSFVGCLAAQ